MSTRKTSLRRLAAGVGALSLALVGFAGGTAAMAATGGDAVAGDIDDTLTGSLTIHKHVDDPESTDNNPAGDPLEDVVFQYQPITNIDLTVAADWVTIEAAYATQPGAAPDMTGLTLGTAVPMDATDVSGVAFEDNMPVGAYYVTELSSGPNLITAKAIPFIITIPEPNSDGTWNYLIEAYPKNDIGTITPTKTVGEPSQTVGLGGTVDWDVSAPLPALADGYDEVKIQDTLATGLTFQSWQSVTVGPTTLDPLTDYDVDTTTHEIELTAAGLGIVNGLISDGPVTITAVLRTTVTTVGAHPNTASIVVNGNPPILTDTPQTNWAALEITKVDSVDSAEILPGAEFDVFMADADGNATGTAIASGTTDAFGILHLDFYIGTGTTTTMDVVIEETAAPQGYVLPEDPFFGPYTLTADETVAASTTTGTVTNYAPTAPGLPLTGSTGTLLFTIVGAALIVTGGGIALLRRRRSRV